MTTTPSDEHERNGRTVLRAVRFPTTVDALCELGAADPTSIPFDIVVEADHVGLRLIGRRTSAIFLDVPARMIRSISVAETESGGWGRQVELAVVVTVEAPTGSVSLPIVPVSDDGRRSLTWMDAEVREIASRIGHALGTTRSGK